MSLQPLTWFSLLANIKGGFRMIPAANILGVADISYRFDNGVGTEKEYLYNVKP